MYIRSSIYLVIYTIYMYIRSSIYLISKLNSNFLSMFKNFRLQRYKKYTIYNEKDNKPILSPYYPLLAGGKICQSFSCVSYEATKRVSRWQHVYGVGLHWPPVHRLKRLRHMMAQSAATILKPLVPNPHSTSFTQAATVLGEKTLEH